MSEGGQIPKDDQTELLKRLETVYAFEVPQSVVQTCQLAADEIRRLNRKLDRIDRNVGHWMDRAAESAEAEAYREGIRDGRRFDEY